MIEKHSQSIRPASGLLLLAHSGNFLPVQNNGSFVRLKNTGQQVKESRFARPALAFHRAKSLGFQRKMLQVHNQRLPSSW